MTFAKKTQIRRVVMNGSGHGYLILSITGGFNRQCQIDCIKIKLLPAPMAHRAAPISVSSSPRPRICECSESYSGGWSTGSFACLTFPLHSLMPSARREGSEYHFQSLWHDSAGARTHDLPVVRQTLYHCFITPV